MFWGKACQTKNGMNGQLISKAKIFHLIYKNGKVQIRLSLQTINIFILSIYIDCFPLKLQFRLNT